MVDFVALLKKSINSQKNPTPQLRQKIYERAREAMARKLAEKSLPAAVVQAQKKLLDDAVLIIENEYANAANPSSEIKAPETTLEAERQTQIEPIQPDEAKKAEPQPEPENNEAYQDVVEPAASVENNNALSKDDEEHATPLGQEAETEEETTPVAQGAISARETLKTKGKEKLREALKSIEERKLKAQNKDKVSSDEKRKSLSFDFSVSKKRKEENKDAAKSENVVHYDDIEQEDETVNLPAKAEQSPAKHVPVKREIATTQDTGTKAALAQDVIASNEIASDKELQSNNIAVAAIDSDKIPEKTDIIITTDKDVLNDANQQLLVDNKNLFEDTSDDSDHHHFDERLNIDEAVAGEKHYDGQAQLNHKDSTDILEIPAQTGDFDIVSDIFTQAARKNEREAAKKRWMILFGVICGLVLVVAFVLFFASRFLTNKQDIAKEVSTSTVETQVENPRKAKLTQRLKEDGSEEDPGSASETTPIGEGLTTTESSQIARTPPPPEVTFYRPRTDTSLETVKTGTVHWSLVTTGSGSSADVAVRGDITIPDENLTLQMVLRRNKDITMPTTYLLDFSFKVPNDFEGRAIDRILRLVFKASEQSKGQMLTDAVYSKFEDNYFLYSLKATNPDTNLEIMQKLNWISMELTDKDNRVIELTFAKGSAGEQIFQQVLNQWQQLENAPTLYDQNSGSNVQNSQTGQTAPNAGGD